jgi:hypothetical protein
MLGFKPTTSAADMLAGICSIRCAKDRRGLPSTAPSLTEQFPIVAD